MKRLIYIFTAIGVAIASFFTGFLIRQPKVNKLKKQVETLQRDNRRLITMYQEWQQKFADLFVHHKALKALQFNKKAATKEKMTECLTMQYAILEYVSLLMKRVKYGQELAKEEIIFFNAFNKAIDGKPLSTSDKVKVNEYVKTKHGAEIRDLRECDYSAMMAELYAEPEQPQLIFCAVKLAPKKKIEYFLTEDNSIMVGDVIVVPVGRKKETYVEVLDIEHYDKDTVPAPLTKVQCVKRKCSDDELALITAGNGKRR